MLKYTQNMILEQNIYQEPKFDYVIIKTTKARVQERGGDIYQATRSAWRVGERITQYKYVVSVVEKVVQAVFVVDRWHKIEDGFDRGRYEFTGTYAHGEEFDDLIGKTIPQKYRVPGMASPVLYKKV